MALENGHILLVEKICMDLSLFVKYLAIYYFFETRICHVTRVL